jgi:Lipocalin-like domain
LEIFNRVVDQDFDKEDRMNKNLTLAVAVIAMAGLMALVSSPLFSQSRAASQPTIQGVWRVTEITTTGPNASKNSNPQPGLYIFTAKHYSIVRVNGMTPRPNLPQDLTTATTAQLLATYGTAFTAQSGTYEVAGGKLTTRPLVAKNTAPMASGAFNTAAYNLDGTTLTITQESGTAGLIENPTTWKLTRIE